LVLERDAREFNLTIPRAKLGWQLAKVLDVSEVEELFRHTRNQRNRVMLMTIYATGLRVGELVRLKACNIDGKRMQIHVEKGKGRKDRYTLLSTKLLEELRSYWRSHRLKEYLFVGRDINKPMDVKAVQRVYKMTAKAAGITKGGGPHILRHSFATHLLENGMSMVVIQRLLGHKDLKTTSRYLHITKRAKENWKSPLDLLSNDIPVDMEGNDES